MKSLLSITFPPVYPPIKLPLYLSVYKPICLSLTITDQNATSQ